MKKKKLYYLPGMISIIGLPVLLFFWGPADPVYHNSIRLNMTSDAKDIPGFKQFNRSTVFKTIKNKKIITIDVDNPGWDERTDYLNNRKYSFIQSEMERLQFTGDTSAVLKIHLGSFNTYSDFVCLLNYAIVYDFKRYALVDDDFYFLPTPHLTRSYETIALPVDDLYEAPKIKEPTAWESFKKGVKYTWWNIQRQMGYLFSGQQQNKLLVGAFFLLILIPAIIRIRKYTRNNTLFIPRSGLHTP